VVQRACCCAVFRDVSVLAVLVTAYEIIAAAVLRSAASALGPLLAREKGRPALFAMKDIAI
jgi:hypothetical protein